MLSVRTDRREPPLDWMSNCTELPSIRINDEVILDVGGDSEEKEERQWVNGLLIAYDYRSIFRTDSKLMGLATIEARDDDMLCIPIGGEVPWIVRPLEGDYYEFIDECYVAGIMDGEMMGMLVVEESWGEHKQINLR